MKKAWDGVEILMYRVMYGRTYTRKRRARDIRRAAERAQRDTDAVQELAEPSSG